MRLLTQDSDFTPYMARGVGPDVRNAAMKKLFTDPHYNVMDGLDIYIDDYSKSDPIPQAMLRQMVGAKFLKIFDDEEDQAGTQGAAAPIPEAPLPPDSLNNPTPESMAQSPHFPDARGPNPNLPSPEHASQPEPSEDSGTSQHDHAHSYLRLQPDHAPSAPDAGRGTS